MNVERYKKKLNALKTTKPIPKLNQDPQCIIDCKNLLDELFWTILNQNQDYGIKWMFGLQRYTNDKKRAIRKPFKDHLRRGHIIEVELFGHFNKELSFTHPAVVLHDNNSDWLLIAPISTPKYGSPDSLHIDVTPEDGLRHNSGICLDDIRVIDKHRVLYQHVKEGIKQKLPSQKLNEIDSAILKHYLPFTYRYYNKIETELEKERAEHNALKKEYTEIQQELTLLKQTIQTQEVAATKQ
ncbi:type II toxin-antitoxin system PemK/MazF family toxin [Bacillus pseudomycoides]|uniref:type II toxin-antitoxin system PemK/MazF family toxin n=1 Tax=Bacillus pseudomycoides TaxID=64104 RepID=UPI001F0ABC5A|nr:type II toxin-antitoxin system PemK/MazF family toxin [Bacillus pseudomycoides]